MRGFKKVKWQAVVVIFPLLEYYEQPILVGLLKIEYNLNIIIVYIVHLSVSDKC